MFYISNLVLRFDPDLIVSFFAFFFHGSEVECINSFWHALSHSHLKTEIPCNISKDENTFLEMMLTLERFER